MSRAFGVLLAFTRAVRGVTCHLDGGRAISLAWTRPLHLPPLVHTTLCSREMHTSRGAVHVLLMGVLAGSLPVIALMCGALKRAQISDAQAGVSAGPASLPTGRRVAGRDPSVGRSRSAELFEVRSEFTDGSSARAVASVSACAHSTISLVAYAFISARMKEFSTAQLIITSAMAHEGASASHGARFWPLGPQPWHREATQKRRAAGPRQRQEIVIPGVYVRLRVK